MKKIIVYMFLLVVLSNCIVPFAGRQLINYDPNSNGTSIRFEKQGTLLLLGLLPTESLLDLKTELTNLKQNNQCKELKNIDLLYYDHNFYLVGWEKLVIQAECIK